ncbi:unnamed protein product [Mycena citricolor]|nr:unnamed protein product [Mycena citricolor]
MNPTEKSVMGAQASRSWISSSQRQTTLTLDLYQSSSAKMVQSPHRRTGWDLGSDQGTCPSSASPRLVHIWDTPFACPLCLELLLLALALLAWHVFAAFWRLSWAVLVSPMLILHAGYRYVLRLPWDDVKRLQADANQELGMDWTSFELVTIENPAQENALLFAVLAHRTRTNFNTAWL